MSDDTTVMPPVEPLTPIEPPVDVPTDVLAGTPALDAPFEIAHSVIPVPVLEEAIRLVARAKEETGYAQTGVLNALRALLTTHLPS